MALNQAILSEFDHEMANTRKTLERVPEDKFDWKPHPKSFAMGPLATHLATLPSWGANHSKGFNRHCSGRRTPAED